MHIYILMISSLDKVWEDLSPAWLQELIAMPAYLWEIVLPLPGCPSAYRVIGTWLQNSWAGFRTAGAEERFITAEGDICLYISAHCRAPPSSTVPGSITFLAWAHPNWFASLRLKAGPAVMILTGTLWVRCRQLPVSYQLPEHETCVDA